MPSFAPEIETCIRQLYAEKIYGRPVQPVDRIAILRKLQEIAPIRTYELMLPLYFSFDSKPITLNDYRPFSPLFYCERPKRFLIKSGRQVGKSLSISMSSILIPGQNPNFTSLVATPLGEQVRRLSTLYLRPLMQDSPMNFLWSSPKTRDTLYQHEFPNKSNLILSFASLSADRIRGIPADMVSLDEIQDFNADNLPVIESTTDASEYGLLQYTGTPKSMENTIQGLWTQSSQAEWIVRCEHCGKDNIPAADYDLLEMIGPWSPDISEARPGTVCAKCKKPINPRYGHWQHRYPEKRERFAGYHIPQIILPIHFAREKKWRTLLERQSGAGSTTTAMFYNEVLGESVDAGQKLVSATDLIAAGCLGYENNPQNPSSEVDARIPRYTRRVLAVDWAGGGEVVISFTVMTLLGILPDGTIDVLWGKRCNASLNHIAEAKECLYWMTRFKADYIAHDYTGAGALRETFLLQAGLDPARSIPIQMVGSAKWNLIMEVPPTDNHSRRHFRADKTRSLLYTIGALKQGKLRFFTYDGGKSEKGVSLMDDFLALVEEKTDGRSGGDSYIIHRNPLVPDDFAQAVNMGCLALWNDTHAWPNFAFQQHNQPDVRQVQYSYDEDEDWDVVV